jgi:hypothetical protein
MKAVRYLLSTAAAAGLAVSANAQPPLNMMAPPPPVPLGIAPQPAMPGSPTIWDKLGISKQQREFCRRKTCRTPFGAMMNTIVSPISRLSCGLIPPFCPPTPSLAELQDPGAVGAAAKVKQDRAGAEERIKAVKYLATVDCHYWPEAEDALINALRNDRNECVRYEAAVALASGCCCTPKVMIALSNTVGCGTSDGGFMEKSARVRQAAGVALEHCMQTCACADLPTLPDVTGGKKEGEKERGERQKDDKQSKLPVDDSPSAELKAYYKNVSKLPKSVVLNYARQAQVIGRQMGDRMNAPSNELDLLSAGVPTASQAAAFAPRPANLLDMLTGQDQPPATFAYTQMPVRSTTVPVTTTVRTVAPSPIPKTLVSAFAPQSAEPPMRKPIPPVQAQSQTSPMVLSQLDSPAPSAPAKKVAYEPAKVTYSVPARPTPPITYNVQPKPTNPVTYDVQPKPTTPAVVVFKPVEVKKVEVKKVEPVVPVKAEPPVAVQPAGIARVTIPPAPAEYLVPATDPVPTAAPPSSSTMVAEPLPIRPAIPARR